MTTSRPIYDGSEYGSEDDEYYVVAIEDGHPAELNHIPSSYTVTHKLASTDLELLPSQPQRTRDSLLGSLHANGTVAQVQPTDNPYHWEVPTGDHNNISTWVKASWVRTNEIVRRRAGNLKRNTAVRWSGKERATPEASAAVEPAPTASVSIDKASATHRDHVLQQLKIQRSFSFEDHERCECLSIALKQNEEEVMSKTVITRVDSGVVRGSEGRGTRFYEELDERPRIARTFSEILGSEPFVPTALLDNE